MKIKNFISKKCNFHEVSYVEVEDFFDRFGQMTSQEVENFLGDPNNGYALGEFFYRITGCDKFFAFNGLQYSSYYGGRTTLNINH